MLELCARKAGRYHTPMNFVLIHGGFHGGWCWRLVAQRLRAQGHHVTHPTQTGLGERRHLASNKLTLEVLQGNRSAITLYERIGFAGYQLDPALGQAQFLQKVLA